MRLNEYILLLLKDNPMKIPSSRFWGITLLIIQAGVIIKMDNNHILTPEDCVKEMEDYLRGIKYDGGWVRSWWEQYQYLRNLIEKQRWM